MSADLQALRNALHPAFLWDVARRRVAWANAAAVQFFGALGLSDLVERPFDEREEGVRALQEAGARLLGDDAPAESLRLRLRFPSTGRDEALAADVRPHALPDARPGLLVVAADSSVQATPGGVLAEILREMPQPVLAVNAAGELLFANPAARDLLGDPDRGGLAGLFPSRAAAAAFLLRAREAGTAVITREASTRLGSRTLRITARAAADEGLFVITLDDLTDRLRAERLQQDVPWPARTLADEDEDADAAAASLREPSSDAAGRPAPGEGGEKGAEADLATLRRLMQTLQATPDRSDQAGEETAPAEVPSTDETAGADAAEQAPASGEKPSAPAVEDSAGDAAAVDATPPATPEETRLAERAGAERPEESGARPRISIRVRKSPSMPADEPSAPVAEEHEGEQAAASEAGEEASEKAASAQPETEPPVHSRNAAEASSATAHAEAEERPVGEEAGQEDEEHEPRPPRPQPPQLVRDVLDHRPEPIILHRAASFFFANAAARRLFGFAPEDERWDDMARQLTESPDNAELTLADINGRSMRFRLKRDVFPWRSGVVVQSTLQRLDTDREASARLAPDGTTGADAVGPAPASMQRAAPVIRIHTERGTNRDTSAAAGKAGPEEAATSGGARAALALQATDLDHPAGGPDVSLQAMLEAAADGIITLNVQGEILSFSAGAEGLFGLSARQVLGKPFDDLLTEPSRDAFRALLQRLREQPAPARQDRGREVTALDARGQQLPLHLTLGVLPHDQPGEGQNRAVYCVVVRDISSFKRREYELHRAKEEAEQLSARKSEFLARISHELRTPLNAILGFSDVLRQELYGHLGNEKYRDYVRDIYKSGEHLLALVNDLLDLARIEAGRYELSPGEVDLAQVVEESVNLMREQIGKAGIVLRRITPDGLPRVVADARSIKQILLNLLSNAVKFASKGDQVVVALRQRPDGALELVVKDSGPGMSEEELQDALQPFRRVPRTGADKPGTGLGLPLAKALAEANRARFEIESEPGKGTEARIIFPPHRVLA